ncbi:hypothetical protein [Aestuariibius sp. HNIBRBA575]|uniref:hypothetical protein n=1 Tax=Aestuariibius sp. HNIBRBA575 TaxID=3233343 RepID=UPI0034A1C46E
MNRRAFMLGAPVALAGCGAKSVWAPDDHIARVRYSHPGPRSLTLYTMRNTTSDNGAHSSLLINASQRVIFDPAGSFSHASIPERNDVVFGVDPRVEDFYVSYHSRITYYTQIQHLEVPADVAEQALQAALNFGPVSQAMCTRSVSTILSQLSGFERVNVTWFPENLANSFGAIPGVVETTRFETDDDNKDLARQAYDIQLQEEAAARAQAQQ